MKFIVAKGWRFAAVVIRSFGHHPCDKTIWLSSVPIFEGELPGDDQGPPPIFPFHQPHGRTCGLMHLGYEVQRPLLYHPLTFGEDSLLDSKFVLAENGRGVRDFHLTLYKRSHSGDQQESGLSATTFKMLSSSLGLGTANTSKMEGVGTAHRQPASYLVTWNESVPRS
ncbi:hypothetical protein TNCV_594341 [Trichonephila clavipes]|nr:hypothetical protein TNCV_594341 [Trichonephila clavipes]